MLLQIKRLSLGGGLVTGRRIKEALKTLMFFLDLGAAYLNVFYKAIYYHFAILLHVCYMSLKIYWKYIFKW